jgi:hypothetical protein
MFGHDDDLSKTSYAESISRTAARCKVGENHRSGMIAEPPNEKQALIARIVRDEEESWRVNTRE